MDSEGAFYHPWFLFHPNQLLGLQYEVIQFRWALGMANISSVEVIFFMTTQADWLVKTLKIIVLTEATILNVIIR